MVGIYLSGTGNTKYCVEKLISLIDMSAEVIAIESPDALTAIQQNEVIFIGYPTQFSNAPYMVRDFIKKNGLVNICIVEKITKFDNDIFLDFRAAGKSFAGSTIRLRMACP